MANNLPGKKPCPYLLGKIFNASIHHLPGLFQKALQSQQNSRAGAWLAQLDAVTPADLANGALSPHIDLPLRRLAAVHSPGVARDMISRWVVWIANEQYALLVDTVADRFRTNPQVVLPLAEHFALDLPLTDSLKRAILEQTFPSADLPDVTRFYPKLYPEQKAVGAPQDVFTLAQRLIQQVKEYLERHPLDGDLREKVMRADGKSLPEQAQEILAALPGGVETAKANGKLPEYAADCVRQAVQLLFSAERARREREVYRRIASQLAHMSDPRFYKDEKSYQRAKAELEKHAVPVVVFKLPERRDLETRWRLGLLLGYVGGRTAVDPLVQTLIGEESTRQNRQQLLEEFYLQPTDQLRQEATKILKSAIQDARENMMAIRRLNEIIFFIGILLIIFGIIVALSGAGTSQTVIAFISGGGGVAAIANQLFWHPLDRIQKSLADMIQLETAFTGFIWELNLNNTYIQSQYVSKGVLTDADITRTMAQIKEAMADTMKLVEAYTKPSKKDQPAE